VLESQDRRARVMFDDLADINSALVSDKLG
jgi:hypothetical protein